MKNSFVSILVTALMMIPLLAGAQMITGVWKGKINKQAVELKIIQKGDSLTGTSYYYTSPSNYRRYSIRGYFDAGTNETVWWDDQLIEEKNGKNSLSHPGKIPLLARADFNCPGGARMMLDGKAAAKDDEDRSKGDLHLDKTTESNFYDEWDYVIDNYTAGANNPDIIDSIHAIAYTFPPVNEEPVKPAPVRNTSYENNKPAVEKEVKKTAPVVLKQPEPARPLTIEQKFTTRNREYNMEIPVTGDSIELRFYDNAQVDGDSISLFLNDKMIFEHIRLTASAYVVKIATADLKDNNDLVMVAENLGEIPPNTSYMVALVNNKKYDAMLTSTEQTSAAIKLVKSWPGQ